MRTGSRDETCDIDEKVADGSGYADPEYLETIALLQEEIVRLEAELQARGDRPSEAAPQGVARAEDEFDRLNGSEHAVQSHPEVERLTGDLASREETVALLLDQLNSLEEARTAERAEWEQLSGWVAELERRVEGQDEDALGRLQTRLGDQQREAEELRTKLEQHRRGWDVQREVYDERLPVSRKASQRPRPLPELGRTTMARTTWDQVDTPSWSRLFEKRISGSPPIRKSPSAPPAKTPPLCTQGWESS